MTLASVSVTTIGSIMSGVIEFYSRNDARIRSHNDEIHGELAHSIENCPCPSTALECQKLNHLDLRKYGIARECLAQSLKQFPFPLGQQMALGFKWPAAL
jgi:hypothetical protein